MKIIAIAVLIGCCQVGVTSLHAQAAYIPNQLPPVTVEGTAPTTLPQSDSSATTVVSGDDIKIGEITAVRDLTAETPNFTVFDGNNDRSPKFSIRGLRENSFGVGEPVIGLYVDDVPYYDVNSRGVPLYDIERIEFARGVQGTLFGASGVGGVMNITTQQPGNDWHGSAGASYGDDNAQNYQLDIGGALLKNQLYLNIAGLYGWRDGYVHNLTLGDHPDTQNTLSGRAELRWTPTAALTIALTASAETLHDGFVPTYRPGVAYLPAPTAPDPSPFNVERNVDGFVNTTDTDEALRISYDFGPAVVTSVTTRRDWRQNLLQDFDFSPLPIAEGFSQPDLQQWGEELHVKSPDSAEQLKWLGGFYFLDNDLHDNSGYVGGSPSVTDSDSQTYAVFGQATCTVASKLDLTAGLRATFDDRSLHGIVVSPSGAPAAANDSADFSAIQPKFALAWHFTPQNEVYLSAAEGYQSGGFNSFINNTAYNPARSWNYELGLKSSCDDNKYITRADLFYTDTEGYQVIRINPANALVANLLNARRAVSYGAELEFLARPVSDVDLNANAGYTCATYQNFLDPTSGLQLANKPISFVPEFTANVGATWHFIPHFYLRGQAVWVGRYHLDDSYTALSGPTVQDTYALVNAQLGYESKSFGLYLYAKNVFDRHYFSDALNFGAGSGATSLILQPGDPETCGIAATARF